MKRIPILVLLSLCLVLSLSGCEPEDKPPVVYPPTSSTVSSEAVSSETASSEPVVPPVPVKKDPVLLSEYDSFTTDFAIDDPEPEKEIDVEIQQKIENGGIVPLTNGVCLDLDGDDKGEVIQLETDKTELGNDLYRLTVGNRRIEMECITPTGELYAGILGDGQIQLLASEDGPSSDPYTYFFEYNKGGLWHIGGVEGHPDSFVRTPSGFTSSTRSDILQNWRYPQEHVIASHGVLSTIEGQYIPSCVADVPKGLYPMGTIVRLTGNLTLLDAPSPDSETSYQLPRNKLAVLSATDNMEWIYVMTVEPNPKGGWLQLKKGSYSTIVLNGIEYDANTLFIGLNQSD